MVVDKNGVDLVAGQNVLVHQEDGIRKAVVVQPFDDAPTVNEQGHWVDINDGKGPEGMPSYLLEVIGEGKFYVNVKLADPEAKYEWREVAAASLQQAIVVAEQMDDVEACLEASIIPGGVLT